ncbi:hypothetical protein C7M84_021336 [Penaeus vannamei]|uniref:Uncharacterized protein n=1 Tax=Penaeus vannamei TaxID=6689 RepID=A0A3R7MLS3_PENVA|nr:hypothetical protein C7M84_021336 [Penaeus vannamei]
MDRSPRGDIEISNNDEATATQFAIFSPRPSTDASLRRLSLGASSTLSSGASLRRLPPAPPSVASLRRLPLGDALPPTPLLRPSLRRLPPDASLRSPPSDGPPLRLVLPGRLPSERLPRRLPRAPPSVRLLRTPPRASLRRLPPTPPFAPKADGASHGICAASRFQELEAIQNSLIARGLQPDGYLGGSPKVSHRVAFLSEEICCTWPISSCFPGDPEPHSQLTSKCYADSRDTRIPRERLPAVFLRGIKLFPNIQLYRKLPEAPPPPGLSVTCSGPLFVSLCPFPPSSSACVSYCYFLRLLVDFLAPSSLFILSTPLPLSILSPSLSLPSFLPHFLSFSLSEPPTPTLSLRDPSSLLSLYHLLFLLDRASSVTLFPSSVTFQSLLLSLWDLSTSSFLCEPLFFLRPFSLPLRHPPIPPLSLWPSRHTSFSVSPSFIFSSLPPFPLSILSFSLSPCLLPVFFYASPFPILHHSSLPLLPSFLPPPFVTVILTLLNLSFPFPSFLSSFVIAHLSLFFFPLFLQFSFPSPSYSFSSFPLPLFFPLLLPPLFRPSPSHYFTSSLPPPLPFPPFPPPLLPFPSLPFSFPSFLPSPLPPSLPSSPSPSPSPLLPPSLSPSPSHSFSLSSPPSLPPFFPPSLRS